jgi:hypothetical protein
VRLRKEADLLTPSVEELIRRAAGVRKPKPARESLAESTDSPAFPRTSLDSRPPTSHPKQFFNGWGPSGAAPTGPALTAHARTHSVEG